MELLEELSRNKAYKNTRQNHELPSMNRSSNTVIVGLTLGILLAFRFGCALLEQNCLQQIDQYSKAPYTVKYIVKFVD